MKQVSALYGQEVEFLNDKLGGKQSNKITLEKHMKFDVILTVHRR